MSERGYERGSFLDLAIVSGGNIDCAIELCERNGACLSDETEIDVEYETEFLAGADSLARRSIELECIRPATGLSADDVSACPFGGIGFMGIEIDFEVS